MADETLGGGGSGLLVATGLNFAFDGFISDSYSIIIATAFDNLALAYLLGHCRDESCASVFVRVYLPGILYFVLCASLAAAEKIAPELWDTIQELPIGCGCFDLQLKEIGTGAQLGIILYTVMHELAPEMASDKAWVSAIALSVAFVLAPCLLVRIEAWEEGNKSAASGGIPFWPKIFAYLLVAGMIIAVSYFSEQDVLPAESVVPALAAMGTGMLTWGLLLNARERGYGAVPVDIPVPIPMAVPVTADKTLGECQGPCLKHCKPDCPPATPRATAVEVAGPAKLRF